MTIRDKSKVVHDLNLKAADNKLVDLDPALKLPNLKRWGFFHRAFYRFVEMSVPRLLKRGFRLQITGQHYLDQFPEGTPLLLCGNHRSHLDGIILGAAVAKAGGGTRRYIAFMGKGKSMQENLLFRFMSYIGGFPVYKENPEPALDYACNTLRAGMAVAIFPQGGRVSRTPLSDYHNFTKDGQSGVGRIILKLNGQVPVLPFYIHGSAEALGIGNIAPRWGSYITIKFGKPMWFKQFAKLGSWTSLNKDFFLTAREIVNLIMNQVWDLLREVEIDFLEFLEDKLGISFNKDDEITDEHERLFGKLLQKISLVSPNEIRKYVKSLYRD